MFTRETVIRYIADAFDLEPNEDGTYDLNDYDWTAGCNADGVWMCLSKFVEIFDDMAADFGLYDD